MPSELLLSPHIYRLPDRHNENKKDKSGMYYQAGVWKKYIDNLELKPKRTSERPFEFGKEGHADAALQQKVRKYFDLLLGYSDFPVLDRSR